MKWIALTLAPLLAFALVGAGPATQPKVLWSITADHADGIYQAGETATWTINYVGGNTAPATQYILKRGQLVDVGHGALDFKDGHATVSLKLDQPETVLLEVKPSGDDSPSSRGLGGVVASPDQIKPSAPPPDDFDAFWKSKLDELNAVPVEAKLDHAEAGRANVDYFKITMNNIRGSHIDGQLARPTAKPNVAEKFPAVLVVQWAGVYPLQKSWVTDRAADGWLALDIEAHDLPIDKPADFYKQQFDGPLKNYWAIGNDDRDTSYFLRMYLSCWRAADYLAHRDDWDGKTLIVMGGSQGGQQALMTAGFYPGITAALADVPAGCDMLGPTVGRRGGWPQWFDWTRGVDWHHDLDAAKVHEASRYFDVANFTPHIKRPVLIGTGLIDETCPAAGVLAAANLIASPKQVLLFPRGQHQDEHNSHGLYNDACWKTWMPALLHGNAAPVGPSSFH